MEHDCRVQSRLSISIFNDYREIIKEHNVLYKELEAFKCNRKWYDIGSQKQIVRWMSDTVDRITNVEKINRQAARARGRYGGRPESIPADKKELAYELVMANDMPIIEIAKTLGMSRMSVYRIIEKKRAREKSMLPLMFHVL